MNRLGRVYQGPITMQMSIFGNRRCTGSERDAGKSIMADEEGFTGPSRTPMGDPDAVLLKKQALMLERLANRHQNRLENSANRALDSESPFSSTQSFLSRFSDSKRSIESEVARCRATPPDASQVRSQIDQISFAISDLEKLVAENSYSLPSYEVRASLKSISEMKQSVDDLNLELIPKRKFTFRNKAPKKKSNMVEVENSNSASENSKQGSLTVRDSPGFRNKEGQTFVRNFKGSETSEFTLSDLDSCEVRLVGNVRALFVHRLRNCKVYSGPVMGSNLIDEVEDCVFVMASHQIRIHNAKKSDFYLRVRSRPIIEDSHGVRFAPFCYSYEGIDEDLRDANLIEETGNWANVDDFGWLRALQSPNWSILPENERMETVVTSTM